MVYLNLKGGLGNMMFQIASTISISLSENTDYSFPNLNNHLKYLSLEKTHNPNVNYCSEYLELPFLREAKTLQPTSSISTINYPFHYENIQIPKSDIIIDGFFQSEKYFKQHEEKILELFLPNTKIKDYITEKYPELLNNNITSVHIRRGDYTNSSHHFTQSKNYYDESMDKLKSKTDLYFIFSDDIDWCKNNFKDDNIYFIENEKDYIEMYMMSMCSNNIISNSSFSWWGAWLNQNKTKIVIGPKIWFGDSLQFLKTDDILPDKWIKL
jgi:hypothetical protein